MLARVLKHKLQPYVTGEVDLVGFRAKFTAEAAELGALPFGVPMLHLIGCISPAPRRLTGSFELACLLFPTCLKLTMANSQCRNWRSC